jgi:hypothetical protein
MSETGSFAFFLFGPRTAMQIFSQRIYWVICTAAMPPRFVGEKQDGTSYCFGYHHMIGRVLDVSMTTTAHSCGLSSIMCDTGNNHDAINGMRMP